MNRIAHHNAQPTAENPAARSAAGAAADNARRPVAHVLAEGNGWRLSEFVCTAGPDVRPFEERHADVAISAVVEGTFQYRADTGKALLYPGAVMLGNSGTCFECGHAHGVGDRCIGFQFAPSLFEEIAASIAGSSRFRFAAAMLPALPALTVPIVAIQAGARGASHAALEERAIDFVENVLRMCAGTTAETAAPHARDERRIGAALRHIEANVDDKLDLDALAGIACMSKYHFLRTFRRAVGVTPYHYLLGLRLRRAALRLGTTDLPVSTVAFDSGFGDLSTFNHGFRALFGVSPGAYRAQASRPRPGGHRRARR
ncbi:MAG: helix-turn-helix domain-containing protein [Alphaproteobacteria bacterium]